MNCPMCGTKMEEYTEVDLEGFTYDYILCPKCGTEVGGDLWKLTPQERETVKSLRRAMRSQGGVTSES